MNIRKCEWVFLCLWMLKDLAWVQDWFWIGMTTGIITLIWSMNLLTLSLYYRNYNESWHCVAQFLWVFGNFWWMWAELHDINYPYEYPIYDKNTQESGYMLIAALAWLCMYYIGMRVILPRPSQEGIDMYEMVHAKRFYLNGKQYENLHIILWLLKDTAWNKQLIIMWWISVIPTVLIALDFIILATEDRMFYVVQFIWVVSNLTWAFGELYIPQHNESIALFTFETDSFLTMRWYSAWTLVAAILLVVLHLVYLICLKQ